MNTLESTIKISVLSIALIVAAALGQPVLGQDDSLLVTYQGYLTDAAGDPISGDQTLTFTIYDSEGTAVWTEEHSSVPVTNGLFSVILGSAGMRLLPSSEWSDPRDNFVNTLGITVGSDDEIVPRTPLTDVFSAGVSKRVLGDIRTDVGEVEVTNPEVHPGLVRLAVSEDIVGIDVFGNAETPELAGNLQITAGPDEAGLLMTGPHVATVGVELSTSEGANAIRVYSPDPCTPPESCVPALEVVAEAEAHTMKMHSPGADPDDSTDGFQVQVGTSSIELTLFPQAEGAGFECSGVQLGWDTYLSNSYLRLGSTSTDSPVGMGLNSFATAETNEIWLGAHPSSDEGGTLLISTDATPGSSMLKIRAELDEGSYVAGEGVTIDESGPKRTGSVWDETTNDSTWTNTTSGAAGSRTELHNRQGSSHHNSAVIAVEDGLTQLTLLNGDPVGPPDVLVQATTDGGGRIGINTDTPDEALDVVGTTQTTAFKMPTAAADGHVLTSDDDGNGTWQAPGSAGYKKACGDMYEGMTNASSQVTITFPVTFTAAPHFSVTGIIKSGAQAGKMAHIPKPTPGTSNVTVTIQYWDGMAFDNVGNSVEVMLSYTAMEK